ncbi:MAG: hypothetical protein ABJA66_03325 [Actinomycetota bacterium]
MSFPKTAFFKITAKANSFHRRWHHLCERYLPVKIENSMWRFNRHRKPSEPLQGWKLHISATVVEACEVFAKVVPFLISQDLHFKAPKSLEELSKINCGLEYGYPQVGKFITVYPTSEKQAVKLARKLHDLTDEFVSISVPFDEQYLPDSSVFYRYGAFTIIEMKDENGKTYPAVRTPSGKLVPDDRFQAVPKWISDPFRNIRRIMEKPLGETPLTTTYKVFRAITQRGKGGTYQALDFTTNVPRFCVVKEGRRYGEVNWNGQDGYCLVKYEFDVLKTLRRNYKDVPQVFSSFEIDGNFYFAMECVEGVSLQKLIKLRRRRFSVRQVLWQGVEIAKIIEKIHQSGWIWNDCKPANLIVTHKKKSLRPIDFENAYPINKSERFAWKTQSFSRSEKNTTKSGGKSDDFYAFGAVIYFLLTGKFYDAIEPVEIGKLRRNLPKKLIEITEKLLSDSTLDGSEVRKEFEEILNLL